MVKKRILIIDDEEEFTRLIKLNLEQSGAYEVKVENRGERGLSAALEFNPDLILLDVIMPEVDGGDVFYQLKNNKNTADIPVIFLTAAVNKDELEGKHGMLGGHLFVAKPVEIKHLIYFIETNIRK
ncbi:MAG: response regulator [Candidatus Omnitrophica bacterium]|nr:response regulator [Candidatus Omnitrophota bacterium]